MIRFSLTLLIIMASFSLAKAQIESGRIYLGGTFNYFKVTPESNNATTFTSFSVIPDIGYFISDNFSIGIGIGYNQSKSEFSRIFNLDSAGVEASYTIKRAFSRISINPTLRYYVQTSSEKFYFYAQFRTSVGLGKESYDSGGLPNFNNRSFPSEQTTITLDFNLSPNFVFFPTEKWAIELGFRGITLNIINPEDPEEVTIEEEKKNNRTTFDFGVDSFQPTLGFRVFF